MSEVKRIDIDHKGLPFTDNNGVYVFYEDYAALEAKCAALVVENAVLNKFIVQSCYVFDGEQGELSDAYICAIDGRMPQTTATDAFLAEVRAQGVDSAINTVIAMMNHQHPVTSKAIDIMRVHAYQIRKGVQS